MLLGQWARRMNDRSQGTVSRVVKDAVQGTTGYDEAIADDYWAHLDWVDHERLEHYNVVKQLELGTSRLFTLQFLLEPQENGPVKRRNWIADENDNIQWTSEEYDDPQSAVCGWKEDPTKKLSNLMPGMLAIRAEKLRRFINDVWPKLQKDEECKHLQPLTFYLFNKVRDKGLNNLSPQ